MKQSFQSKNALALLLITILLVATMAYLGNSGNSTPPVSAEYQGIWERTGYGEVGRITDTGGVLYEYTRQTCVQVDTLTNADANEQFANAVLSNDGSSLAFRTDAPDDFDLLFPVQLTKIDKLPSVCNPDNLFVMDTATATFEHLWHTFNDYYAFFDERNIDWEKLYADLRPKVTDDMSDQDLLTVFDSLLKPLDDGHVELITDDDSIDFYEPRGVEKYVMDTFPNQTEYDDIDEYVAELGHRWRNIRSSYFNSEAGGSAGGSSGTEVEWAANTANNVGYLYIGSMSGLTNDGSDSGRRDVDAVNRIMKNVLADLTNTDSLIIDVRFNGGGLDPVSLAIANHFTDQSVLAFSKYTHSHKGDTDTIDAYLNPATDSPYLKPIAVLTSQSTASAAEVFLIALSGLPHVTLLGETSEGILADQLFRTLPNNWRFRVPNVVFMDSNGNKYEVTGVNPEIKAPTNLTELFDQKKDTAIEIALKTLGYSQ